MTLEGYDSLVIVILVLDTLDYVEHSLIKPKKIEARVYQQVLFDSARKGNTLIVLPTGLGKTQIGIMLSAHRLSETPSSRVLMMAPTRPLVLQHKETFSDSLDFPSGRFKIMTGKTSPERRDKEWREGKIFFATPQTVERDLIAGRMSLENFTLLIFDEAHRAVGDYPYGFIAESYVSSSENPLILGLTASPGGEAERIEKVRENLQIDRVEVRSEDHPNVKPYVQTIDIERRMLEMPGPVAKVKKFLENQLKGHLKELKKMGFLKSIQNVGKRELLDVQKKIKKGKREAGPNPPRKFFKGMMEEATAFRLSHCIELLESQGLEALKKYLDRMSTKSQKPGASKSLKRLLKDSRMEKVYQIVSSTAGRVENPKLEEAKKIVSNQLSKDPDSRIILFAHYRDSIEQLVREFRDVEGMRPTRFIGQSSRENEDGLTQKEQAEILKRFRDGEFNLLVSTSVGEEGLDIPGVDLAIFYEAVPSEIRSIQRRGRTGRKRPGRVVILLMKGTRDEAFYWSAVHKEKRMRETLREIDENSEEDDSQTKIKDFEGDG